MLVASVSRVAGVGCICFKSFAVLLLVVMVKFNLDPKAFRVFVQLPDIPAATSILSTDFDAQKNRLEEFTKNYVSLCCYIFVCLSNFD